MVFIGGKCPYSYCFMGCRFQDLFSITRSILVQFPSCFFSLLSVSVHVLHAYSRIDTTAAWMKLRFILSNKSDFYMIDNRFGGARGVMVIVVGSGHGDTSSNPGRD